MINNNSDRKIGDEAIQKIVSGLVRTFKDFPKTGIHFKDITTLLGSSVGMKAVLDDLVDRYTGKNISFVAGMDARGFLWGPALAIILNCGFLMLRKPMKLPGDKYIQHYGKEYGKDQLELSKGILKKGDTVLIMDDLIATGGTALGACRLIEQAGGIVTDCAFVIELNYLPGRKILEKAGYNVYSCANYKIDE